MKIVYSGVMSGKNGFTDALRKVFDEVIDFPIHHLNDVSSADIVFLQPQDTGISIKALQHLQALNTFIINWTGDARDTTPNYCYEYAPYVDLTCFSNMRDVENMRKLGFNSDFLQIGYDPQIYYPDPNIIRDIDIVFMGNNYGHFPLSGLRKQMVTELKRVYGNRFKAYGIGQPNGNYMGNQKGEADILRRSKIAINLSHYDLPRYTSDRMLRSLGSGCAVLSHNYRDLGLDFSNNLKVWNNFIDLKETIDELLSEPIELNWNASCCHFEALNNHTFEHMALNIKKLYEQHQA